MIKLSDAKSEIGFSQNKKATRVREGDYQVFDTGIFDKFFEGKDNNRITNYRYDSELKYNMQAIGGEVYNDHASYGMSLIRRADKDKLNTMFVPQSNSVRSTVVQDGTNFHKIDVCESSPEEYKNIVPEFVIDAYIKHKDNFDEVVILYPEEQQISISTVKPTPIVDDPFLVGKLKCMPGKYFLISYWLDDINAVQFFQEKMSKMLISQEELLLQSPTKMIGIF